MAAQFASTAIISPPVDPNDENAQRTKNILAFLPLMIGYFALQVPSGLSLYYFSNTVVTSAQQIWLRKLGGTSRRNHIALSALVSVSVSQLFAIILPHPNSTSYFVVLIVMDWQL